MHIVDADRADVLETMPRRAAPDRRRRRRPGRPTARASSTRAIPQQGEPPADEHDFYQQVYFHKLGTPTAKDRYELGKDLPRIAEIDARSRSRDGRVASRPCRTATAASFATTSATRRRLAAARPTGDGQGRARSCPRARRSIYRRVAQGRAARQDPAAAADDAGPREAHGRSCPRAGRDRHDFADREGIAVASDRAVRASISSAGRAELRAFDLDGKPATAPKRPPPDLVGVAGSRAGRRRHPLRATTSYHRSRAACTASSAKTGALTRADALRPHARRSTSTTSRSSASSRLEGRHARCRSTSCCRKGTKLDGTQPVRCCTATAATA